MPKLYSSRHIITVLDEHGFVEVDQTGSHKKFRCGSSTVIVPSPKREIPYGTFYVNSEAIWPQKGGF